MPPTLASPHTRIACAKLPPLCRRQCADRARAFAHPPRHQQWLGVGASHPPARNRSRHRR
jgi:hypothetical protein